MYFRIRPGPTLDSWIPVVQGQILKPPAGSGKQLQTSHYRGVDFDRKYRIASDILRPGTSHHQ